MTAPASGRPLLSRTVPVIVASPRVPLPKLGVTLKSNIASAIRAVLNRKIFFIAARPPGKTSREFASSAQVRNRLIYNTFVGFPSPTSFRCLSARWDARCGKPNLLRFGARGDLHPLECLQFSATHGTCVKLVCLWTRSFDSFLELPRTPILPHVSPVLRWMFHEQAFE